MFSHVDTVLDRYRQTDGQTDRQTLQQYIPRRASRRADKNADCSKIIKDEEILVFH